MYHDVFVTGIGSVGAARLWQCGGNFNTCAGVAFAYARDGDHTLVVKPLYRVNITDEKCTICNLTVKQLSGHYGPKCSADVL
eukprot:1249691-Pyramimonas_sp.AAC.2